MLSFRQIVTQQFRQHKHILIGLIVIVILSLSRLILGIVSGFMKSNNQSRVYLAGYLIPVGPVLINFIILFHHRKTTKREFHNTL